MKDRTRPFILKPVFHGAPASWAGEYVLKRCKDFRTNNPDFNSYLKEVKEVILERKLDYCEIILRFLDIKPGMSMYINSRSLLSVFIKTYNYNFSAKQTVDYIEKCYTKYQYLLNDKLVLEDEFEIYSKRSRWDGSTRDFADITLSPSKDPEDYDEYYFINITFCSLETSKDVMDACDTKIDFKSQREIYDDVLSLFDYSNGNKYLNKVYQFTLNEMLKKKIIRKPVKVDYGHTIANQYEINRPRRYKTSWLKNHW